MSYQVLARKWRPAQFSQLVGQDHVKSALINGLSHQRLHHAYLFTGTRGVGKTSIARIFAKSLNCETGVSAEPCGQCNTCLDVDAGRFVDLIEIDAASRTKVGDTREILDNVQYAPTRGRYKIYLIDEVHMLSRHSFNALLKTLEEPPEHVKFLLATTDPQKLPVTILSRCLQFNLQALSPSQITEQLTSILTSEAIPFEPAALALLAKYAKGSMRDALSLTDQAIAQSGQDIKLLSVQAMLGTVDSAWSQHIFSAIFANNGEKLISILERLAKQSPDIEKLLDDMLSLCHLVAMTQIMPAAAKLGDDNRSFVEQVASHLSPEEIQVYYQLLLQGKKDIHLATDLLCGFEMVCLRLLAFKPVQNFETVAPDIKKNLSESQLADSARQLVPDNAIEALEAQDEAPKLQVGESNTAISSLNTEATTVSPPQVAVVLEALPHGAAPASQVEITTATDVDSRPKTVAELELDTEAKETHESMPHDSKGHEPVPMQEGSLQEAGVDSVAAMSDEEAELLAQQAFYQDMAESQGFDPDYDGFDPSQYAEFANQANEPVKESVSDVPENQVLVNHSIQTGSELDNPVLAILASRGIDPKEQPDAFSTAKDTPPETTTNPSTTPLPEENQVEEVSVELKPLDDDEVRFAHEVDEWAQLIERSNLAGLGRQLALNGSVEIKGDQIELTVKQEFAHLLNEKSEAELIEVVSQLAPATNFTINKSELTEMAPSDIQKNINMNRQERAEQSIQSDPLVQSLLTEFEGRLIENSITPL